MLNFPRKRYKFNFASVLIRRKVNDQPDPETYKQKREALEILIAEDQEGIIDLRYFDESGFCLVPYTYRSVIFEDFTPVRIFLAKW